MGVLTFMDKSYLTYVFLSCPVLPYFVLSGNTSYGCKEKLFIDNLSVFVRT
jgi:hypothetical protein